MSKPKTPNRVSVRVGDVVAIIKNWRSHYPEKIFPRDGNSPDCKAAYMARHVCDGIASDVIKHANGGGLSFKQLFAYVTSRQRERIRKAGKHECVKEPCGTMARVTGRGDKTLKRPVVVMRFYECKICGRDMTL